MGSSLFGHRAAGKTGMWDSHTGLPFVQTSTQRTETLAQRGTAGISRKESFLLEQKTQFNLKSATEKKSAFWVCPHASKTQNFTQTKYKLRQFSVSSPSECCSKALLHKVPSITAPPRSTLYSWFCWLTGWVLLKPDCSKNPEVWVCMYWIKWTVC